MPGRKLLLNIIVLKNNKKNYSNTNQMKNLFFPQIFSLTPTFSVTHIAAVLSLDFIWHSFFNIIFRHAVWNEPMCVSVCLMSLLCRKWATSSKGHTSGLWLVGFHPSHLLSISKDGWWQISAMQVTRKAAITCFL